MKLVSKLLAPSAWIDKFLSRPELPVQLCTACGFEGLPVRKKKGHDEIEILLWILFFACGFLYGLSLFTHRATHFHFPGAIVRGFSVLTKLFLASGVVYTVWQVTTESPVCPNCQRDSMIPPDSPKAREFRQSRQ